MRSRITRRLAVAVALVAALAVPAGVAVATPPQGLSPTLLGQGRFTERVKVNTPNLKAKFTQPSDFIVVDLAVAPGGTTGWHRHPGPALVVVTEGTFTLYDGDDRRCRPHRYGPGQAFVDQGGGHVHIGRNETRHPVKLLVTFIVPEGAPPSSTPPTPATADSERAAGTAPHRPRAGSRPLVAGVQVRPYGANEDDRGFRLISTLLPGRAGPAPMPPAAVHATDRLPV